MNIVYLTNEYPPLNTGGIGTSIQNLARELVQQGHQVTVLGNGEQKAWDDCGVRVKFLGQTKFPKLGWFFNRSQLVREINRMVVKDGLDIVESPDWTGLSAGMKIKCPLVIRCNGTDAYFGSLLGYRSKWKVFMAEAMALHYADSIRAVSRFAAETTRRIFHLKMPVGIIPNGIDLKKFEPANSHADLNMILYFGTLVRKKGVLDLAEIFSQVVEKQPSARLVVIGRDSIDRDTGEKSTWSLFKKIASQQALERTEYIGPRSPDQIVNYIQEASVCVFPSYAETFGLAWVEAMACAKAVVASNIGWASEIIEDRVSGILIHPSEHAAYADAILDLLDNPEKRRLMGQNARERVEQLFSIQRVAGLTLDWYREVINAT